MKQSIRGNVRGAITRLALTLLGAALAVAGCGKSEPSLPIPEFHGLYAVDKGRLLAMRQGGDEGPDVSPGVQFIAFHPLLDQFGLHGPKIRKACFIRNRVTSLARNIDSQEFAESMNIFAINGWRFVDPKRIGNPLGVEISLRSNPVEGKPGMFMLVPASELTPGWYSLDLRGMKIEDMGTVLSVSRSEIPSVSEIATVEEEGRVLAFDELFPSVAGKETPTEEEAALWSKAYQPLPFLDEKLKERVAAQWSEIQNQYKRRYDLIPQLVETIRGAANFEQSTISAMTDAHASVGKVQLPEKLPDPEDAAGIPKYFQAQQGLGAALGRLFAVAKNYPELNASQDFLSLKDQLEETENRIASAFRGYIEAANAYSVSIGGFPGNGH